VYDLVARKVFISRDVLFFEHCFPFFQQHSGIHTPLPLPISDDIDNLVSLTGHDQHPQPNSIPAQLQTSPDSPIVQPSASESQQHQVNIQPQDNTLEQNVSSSDTILHPRKSTRSHKTPARFQDYICS